MDPDRPIELLLVIDDGARPSENEVAHRWWGEIIDALARSGMRVSVATTGHLHPWHEELQIRGVRATALGRMHRLDVFGPTWRLFRLLRARAVDAVYSQEAIPGFIGGFAARLARVSVRLYHRHHTFSSREHEMLSRTTAKLSTKTVAFSDAVVRAALRWDASDPDRIRRIRPGVPEPRSVSAEEMAAVRRSVAARPDETLIAVVARLRPEKGIDVLLEAADRVNTGQAIRVLIVGTGPEEDRLRRLAAGISCPVVFVGHQTDITPWYAVSDIVAVPSTQEPLGLVALEAMASGRPVVASEVDGLAETFTNGAGALLFPPGDHAALARQLSVLAASPELRAELGRAGRREYESHYTIRAMVRSIRELVESEIEQSPTQDGRRR